eukprot:Gb_20716 [translate_table: standard]
MDLRIRSMLVVIVFAGARFLNTDFQKASQYNPAALDCNLNAALGSSQTMDKALGKTIASAGANDISGQRHLYNDIDVSGSNPAPNSQNQTNDKTITLHVESRRKRRNPKWAYAQFTPKPWSWAHGRRWNPVVRAKPKNGTLAEN